MFVFMTLHYPSADNVKALARGMAQMRGGMESQPGCLGVWSAGSSAPTPYGHGGSCRPTANSRGVDLVEAVALRRQVGAHPRADLHGTVSTS